MPKREDIIRHQKNYCKLSTNSLAMIAKQQIRINYIKEIPLKSEAKIYIYIYIIIYQKKLLKALGQFPSHDHQTTC